MEPSLDLWNESYIMAESLLHVQFASTLFKIFVSLLSKDNSVDVFVAAVSCLISVLGFCSLHSMIIVDPLQYFKRS